MTRKVGAGVKKKIKKKALETTASLRAPAALGRNVGRNVIARFQNLQSLPPSAHRTSPNNHFAVRVQSSSSSMSAPLQNFSMPPASASQRIHMATCSKFPDFACFHRPHMTKPCCLRMPLGVAITSIVVPAQSRTLSKHLVMQLPPHSRTSAWPP